MNLNFSLLIVLSKMDMGLNNGSNQVIPIFSLRLEKQLVQEQFSKIPIFSVEFIYTRRLEKWL